EPRAMVDAPSPVELSVEDLRAEADPVAVADTVLAEEITRPFDLENDPVVRWRLLRLADDDHVLLGHAHHVAFDGESFGVFRHELGTLYEAFQRGEPSPLPTLPRQYADFAAHQSALLDGDRLAASIEVWRQRLAGVEALELPADRPRPTWPEHTGGTARRRLSPDLTTATRALARERNQTLFTVLFAAYDVLLHRLTGRTDLTVGVPEAGRPTSDLEPLIGYFVDMLVLRCDLGGNPSFGDLVDRARGVLLDAREHADVPFEKLVEVLQPERHTGRAPFFQTAFQVRPAAVDPGFGGLAVEGWSLGSTTAKFDLNVAIGDDDEQLEVHVEYADELFEPTTIERWLDGFEQILSLAVEDPSRRLAELSATTDADRAFFRQVNDVAAAIPSTSLFQQCRAQADARPEAVAVAHGATSIRWHELIERAERLGRDLIAGGIRPGDLVGLCVERGPEMIVGMLGIVAAGAAYVPLDADYPEERLQWMVEDCAMSAMVLTPAEAERLPTLDGITSLTLPRPAAGGSASAVELPHVDGSFPAYVIYTSGSTGHPKGVVVPQQAVTRLVVGTHYLVDDPEQVVAQMASPSFDATTFEVWLVLLGGGTIAIIDRDTMLSPATLADTLEHHGVTEFFLTTAYFQQLTREAPRALRLPRSVFFGGERCEPETVREAAAVCADAGTRLLHVYGPTECTTYATGGVIDSVPDDATSVPIGGPVSNTTVYVVDRWGDEVPIGVPGELWVGGPGVADGYLRRPALTAGVFVPDPFSDVAGARCYRTGDLVRLLPDGRVDILGRIDHQVKLRGFRIEPGEIEAALARHPEIAATFVMVREDRPGDRQLVAYATSSSSETPEPSALRAFLADNLPSFMVPAVVVVLDALPINPNGKVDRKALPAPELGESTEHVAPRDATEAALAEIWADVLGIDAPSVTADFFELGGHSLLATRVAARVRERLGRELPIRSIFDQPTIAELAPRLGTIDGFEDPSTPSHDVRRDEIEARQPTFGQERLWFLDRLMAGTAVYNIPFSQRLRGNLDRPALERAVSELIARHEALRSRFPEVDGMPRVVIEPPRSVRFDDVRDVSSIETAERVAHLREALNAELDEPFDLARGPLIRPRLWRLADEDHVLSLTVHHIVADGASMEILGRELHQLYAAYQADLDAPSPLPAPAAQLSDVAAWQRRRLQGATLDRLLGFWRDQLAGLEPTELPTDHPRPPTFDYAGTSFDRAIGREVDDLVRGVGRRLRASAFQVYLAAFHVLLQRFGRTDDVTVGSLSAGRERAELLEVVGFLVHTQILRTDCSGNPTFAELVGRVRETALRAQAHQEIPFEKLVEELDTTRDPSRHPLFQVAFQYLAFETTETVGDLAAESVVAVGATTKFDFTLVVGSNDGQVAVGAEYATALFERETVERFLDTYLRVLNAALAEPETPI
ncbi:MAG: amino acid adenylation domain-containing protein, partial [Acidobacteriota bacterium]